VFARGSVIHRQVVLVHSFLAELRNPSTPEVWGHERRSWPIAFTRTSMWPCVLNNPCRQWGVLSAVSGGRGGSAFLVHPRPVTSGCRPPVSRWGRLASTSKLAWGASGGRLPAACAPPVLVQSAASRRAGRDPLVPPSRLCRSVSSRRPSSAGSPFTARVPASGEHGGRITRAAGTAPVRLWLGGCQPARPRPPREERVAAVPVRTSATLRLSPGSALPARNSGIDGPCVLRW